MQKNTFAGNEANLPAKIKPIILEEKRLNMVVSELEQLKQLMESPLGGGC